jgi:hypothetical protein
MQLFIAYVIIIIILLLVGRTLQVTVKWLGHLTRLELWIASLAGHTCRHKRSLLVEKRRHGVVLGHRSVVIGLLPSRHFLYFLELSISVLGCFSLRLSQLLDSIQFIVLIILVPTVLSSIGVWEWLPREHMHERWRLLSGRTLLWPIIISYLWLLIRIRGHILHFEFEIIILLLHTRIVWQVTGYTLAVCLPKL